MYLPCCVALGLNSKHNRGRNWHIVKNNNKSRLCALTFLCIRAGALVQWLWEKRSWVWIPAPFTGWTWHFFRLICCTNCNDVGLESITLYFLQLGCYTKLRSDEWHACRNGHRGFLQYHRSEVHNRVFLLHEHVYSPKILKLFRTLLRRFYGLIKAS